MTKLMSSRIHAKARALERYDLVLNRHAYRQVVLDIQNKFNCCRIERQSNRRSVYKLWVQSQLVIVAFDHNRQCIITFLPLDWEPGQDIDMVEEQTPVQEYEYVVV